MIVRLKDSWLGLRQSTPSTFQFYDSPIKSAKKRLYEAFLFKFQFYDSPIKSSYSRSFASNSP